MQPIPYLFFAGNCADAFRTYGEIFGTEPELFLFSAMPEEARAEMPPVAGDAVMHGAVAVGDGWLYGSDDISQEPDVMAGCNVSVTLPDEAETRRVWNALTPSAEVRMDLKPEFFAPLFGTLTDRFGVRWMIMQDGPSG